MKRVITPIALVLTASTLLLAVSPAYATVRGRNGRIAFRRYFNDEHTRGAIFTIRPDGTGLEKITHEGKTLLDTEPDWAPDGKWIAFDRRAPGEPSRLYKVRPDGSHLTLLSHNPCDPGNCVEDRDPAWSPNGTRVAFTRIDDDMGLVAVFVMRADGTQAQQVTPPEYGGGGPQWSPDGTRLVFGAVTPQGKEAVFTIRLDGTDARQLTPWPLHAGDHPDWSPDGRWIVFHSHADQDRQDNVYLVHPNGTELHAITHTHTHGASTWGSYSFSPDGTMITVSHKPGRGGLGNPDVWVMRLDGSNLRNATRSMIFDSAPDWGAQPN